MLGPRVARDTVIIPRARQSNELGALPYRLPCEKMRGRIDPMRFPSPV
jgi:hypothetical protein